jgi:prepilin-type N-terminal cleavage/methylation domain-containing protein
MCQNKQLQIGREAVRRNADSGLSCSARGGFTLIEVIIVVVIISIAAAIVVPMMSSAGSLQIRSAANMIAADLEYAKSMAISRAQRYSVQFDKTTETYRVLDQAGNVIAHPVKKGFNYVIDFKNDGRLDRVDLADANFDGKNTVTFDYLGSPFSDRGASAAQLNSGVVTLRSGNTVKTVRVEPVTGYISVSN